LAKKKDLEKFLSTVKPYPTPKIFREQYSTSSHLAASMLYTAAFTFKDIHGKRVCDLGCGSGRLSIGASYLGAEQVVGIDIDDSAILTAKRNAGEVSLKVEWVVGDIEVLRGRFDTVIQNPPFGVRRRGADVKFLRKALSIADVVYTIHKSGEQGRRFIGKVVEKTGSVTTNIIETSITIPHQFEFHRKSKYDVKVDIYRIVSGL